jgi:signal transduction histidine kinase/CheY-like chemotaxis protein
MNLLSLIKTSAKKRAAPLEGVPLKFVLVVPFILQIFAAVGLTGYFSVRNGQQAVDELANQLLGKITSSVDQHLDTYLSTPFQANQTTLSAIEMGLLDPQNLHQSGQYFWKQMQLYPSFSYVGYSLTDGRSAGAGRWIKGQGVTIEELSSKTNWKDTYYKADQNGNRTKLVFVDQGFWPLSEKWYTQTVKEGKPLWSKIEPQAGAGEYIAASANMPIYNSQHRLVGVLVADLLLENIRDFLRSLKVSPSAKIFIVERDGTLIASSNPEKPFKVVNQNIERLNVLQSSDPLIQATAQYFKTALGGFNRLSHEKIVQFKFKQQQQFVQALPWKDSRGLNWVVVVVVPESDFMAQIDANTRTTILLCIVALMVATLMGILTSRWITQPIVRLSQASQAIANGDFSQSVKVQGVNEIGILAQSFNQMAEQLRQSFEALAQTNQALEDTNTVLETRVEERTAQLVSAKDTADVANRAKSEFLANMSHELRTPLNAILGFTQVMNRDSTLNPDQQENLGIIGRSGDHLLALINDVLDMSKIEAGCITVNYSVFDLYTLLNSITDMLRLKAEAKGLDLLCQWTAEVPQYIQSDEKKLRQVLLNLLGNAVKFTEAGSITLGVQRGCSNVKAQPASSPEATNAIALHFTVKDTGAGIAKHELNTLFDPFVQTETGRKSEQGTGLGLAISQKFVQLMGGDIQVHSQLAQGTTFEFEIQAEVSTPERMTTALKSRRVMVLEPGQPSYRILVTDDRWENRQLLIKLLTPVGFEVQEASNGQEAIAQWETWKPHLIWMDMRMPIMNGYETTRHIKAHLQGQATIIIALTASTLDEERAVVMSAGCEDFVRKPFLENEIFDKMAQHLGVRYIYADLATGELAEPSLAKLDAATLGTMPKEWLNQFSYASAQLDPQMLAQLLTQIPNQQAALRRSLQTHMDDFDFELLMTLAQEAAAL